MVVLFYICIKRRLGCDRIPFRPPVLFSATLEYAPFDVQKQPSRGVPRNRCSENMQQIYKSTPMPKCDFNKVAKQLYWIYTSAWMFYCKFPAYFQNTFPKKISGRLLLNVLLCLSPLLPCIRCIHNCVFWETTAIELRKRQRGVVKIIVGSFMKISMMKLKS